MRKTFLSSLLLFVAAVTLSNCSKDETTDPAGSGYQLRATLEGTTVTWAVEDKIKVVNQDAPATAVEYTLSEGSGTGNGIFAATVPLSDGAKWAFYPSSAFGSYANNAFAFTLPATQEYHATSFANEAYPMVAQSAADGTLAFKNLCGIIKLQLTGNQTITSIQLKTAGEQIAGPATVAMNYTTAPTLACDVHFGTTTVTLKNINSLLSDIPTSFFFVVPAGEYAAGLTFTALDDKGAVINTHTTTKALTVIRSEIAALTPISTLHFPDPKFRAELVATYNLKLTSDQADIDVNNADNKKLFTNTTKLEVQQKDITTLQGIEYFTALTYLYCYENQLTSLDIRTCSMLTKLACGNQHADGGTGETYTDLKLLCLESQKALTTKSEEAAYNKNVIFERVAFPDPKFRAALVAASPLLRLTADRTDIDVNNEKNKKLFANMRVLNVSRKDITTLQGIEYFTALTYLYCYENQLTSLDVSKNTALTILNCYENQLTSLDVRTCPILYQLSCGNQHADGGTGETYTDLKLLCLESQKALISKPDDAAFNKNVIFERVAFPDPKFRAVLVATYKLKLTSDQTNIDVNNADNKKLFASITKLEVQQNEITTLQGIEYFTALTELRCGYNQLTSLDLSKNTALTTLGCYNNRLTSLDVSKNTAIDQLYCSENQLTSLDVSQNTALIWLFCSENQLTDLDVSKNTKLTSLGCQENQLKSLDVTKNTALTSLDCNTNQLTSLDLSQNTALTSLNCNTNQLTSLDLSKNTKLNSLFCYENQLTSLDVSKNTALTNLRCDSNQLTSLDIQPLTSLEQLRCGQQSAGGVVYPNYSELKLYMTPMQFHVNLGTGQSNDKVTRVVPHGM